MTLPAGDEGHGSTAALANSPSGTVAGYRSPALSGQFLERRWGRPAAAVGAFAIALVAYSRLVLNAVFKGGALVETSAYQP